MLYKSRILNIIGGESEWMKMIEIRNAVMKEFPQIEAVYAAAREFMAQTGNPNQWGKTDPAPAVLKKYIENGNLYAVVQDGEICGSFAFIPGVDPTYGYIDGAWHSDTPYCTIHCVANNGKLKGMFSELLRFCETRSSHLRIDTYKDNKIMQRVVEKHGFSYCGIIYLENGSPRMAYDRV